GIRRRLADPAFRRLVDETRQRMLSDAVGRLADGMVSAADTLRDLLSAKGEAARLGAARSILELGTKLRDSVEVEARLRARGEGLGAASPPATSPADRSTAGASAATATTAAAGRATARGRRPWPRCSAAPSSGDSGTARGRRGRARRTWWGAW